MRAAWPFAIMAKEYGAHAGACVRLGLRKRFCMTWDVQITRERRYPDQGWSMEKCVADEAAHHNDENLTGEWWRIWHYRYGRSNEGPGSGELASGPIMDFHAHAWVDGFASRMRDHFIDNFCCTAFNPGTLDGYRERKEQLGVSKTVVLPVPTNARQVPQFNEWLTGYLDDPDIVPFMGIYHGMDDPVGEIRRCAELGFKGVKLHPLNQKFRMADAHMFPIYDAIVEEGLVVLFHVGPSFDFPVKGPEWDCSVDEISRFYDRYPYERAVMAHLGGFCPDFAHAPQLHPEWPGYLDTAFQLGHIPNDVLLDLVRGYGTDRILFGTDAPWDDTADFLTRIAHIGLTDEEQRAILYDNGARLLGL